MVRYPDGRARRLRHRGSRRPSSGAHWRLLTRPAAGFPRRALRPRDPDRLSRDSTSAWPRRPVRPARRCSTTSPRSSGPGGRGGPGGLRRRSIGSRWSCRSSSRFSASSASRATTWATRWSIGCPGRARGRPRAARHRRGQPGARDLSRQPGAGDPAPLGAVPRRRAPAAARRPLRPRRGRRDRRRDLSRPGPSEIVRERSRRPCSPPPTRRWPSRERRPWRRRWRIRRWSSLTRSTRSPGPVPAAAHRALGEPGQPGGGAGSRARDAAGSRRDAGAGGGPPTPARSRAIPGPSRSGRDSPWFARAWGTPARPTGWWPWPTSC